MAERQMPDTDPLRQDPLPVPSTKLSSSLAPSTVNAILKAYHDRVKFVPSEEWRHAVRAVRLLVDKGLTPEQLERAVLAYAKSFPTKETRIRYAKAANRFFVYQNVEIWLAQASPTITYPNDYGEWCHHDPPCPHREWHAIMVQREREGV